MKERPAGGADDLSIRQEVAAAAAAPTEGRSRAWLAILLIGAAASAAYYLPILDAYGRAIWYVGTDCLLVVAVFLGIRLNRPARPLAWALFGLGMAAMALGDVVWYWYSLVQKITPTSSFADLFYLAEYPLLIAGMSLLVRTRPDLAAALDTLMITTGAAVAVFEFIVRPNLETFSGSAGDLIVTVAYPIADVGLLALVVRIGLSGHLGQPAVRLLVAGMIAFFMADIVNLWISLAGEVPDPSLDAVWLMSMAMWAAAVTHPSARVELNSGGTDWVRRRLSRRLLLAAALLILPATMFAEAVAGTTGYLPVLLAGWIVIVALVILRVEAAISLARQSEERFRIIFEDSPAGMTIVRGGRIILANRTVRSMFGLGASDPPSAEVADFVSPDRARQIGDVVAARVRGEMLSEPFETIGRRADSTEFPLAVSPRTIDLPDGRATIAFLRDMTAQRTAEEALRASEHRYRDLFESSPHPMWIYDSETLRFLAVNDTAVGRYGWSVDEFKAMTIADICPPEELPELVAHLRSDEAGRPPTTSTRHVRADGSIIQVEVTTHGLTWDGRPARVVLAEDVTERMKLEEKFRQAQKMEAIGRLAGGIAHDFNNLLTAVSGYGELLRGEFEPGDPRVAEVDEILLASDRAASLTRQLLAFSRRLVLMPRALDLNESVEEVRGMLSRLIGEDVHLNFVPGENLGRVRADPGQLTQVLMNLAVNARDAMPRGGTLTIETRNVMLGEAFVAAHEGIKAGPHVMLRVSDTGTGMDVSTLSHVFEPFFTTKEVGQGTGLGLATVYGIVRASEGTIDVTSGVGRGSTFDIFLPLAPGDGAPSVGPGPVAPAPRGHETILVVEDEASVRKLAVSVLERQGYAVLSADGPGPAEAIAAEHPGPIDLLLTDVVMPGGNGTELAARICQVRPAVKVILMTGYAQESIAHRGALNEGIILVEKPFSPNLLLTRVRMALDSEHSEPPSS
jgi:two-component system cell cycle sensor histidine kinase/response regulator CckA